MSRDLSVSLAKKPTNTSRSSRTAHALRKKTVEERLPKKICQKCSLQGIQSALQLFQLNDDEAILMCKNVECSFMSSPRWEDLVIKRDLSRLNPGLGSRRIGGSRKTSSVCSVSQSHQADTLTTKSVVSAAPDCRQYSSTPLQEDHLAPTPAKKSKFEEDKKTILPIAPFIFGHAHNFSSFERRKPDKEQLSNPLSYSPSIGRPLPIGSAGNLRSSSVGKIRRPSSLESESVSSGSFDSRPATPTFTAQVSHSASGGKVKRLIVAPETLAKIIDGSLQIKVVKTSKPNSANVRGFSTPDSLQTDSDYSSAPGRREVSVHQQIPYQTDCETSFSSPDIQAINNIIQSQGLDSLDISQFNPVPLSAEKHLCRNLGSPTQSSLPISGSTNTSALANLWMPDGNVLTGQRGFLLNSLPSFPESFKKF